MHGHHSDRYSFLVEWYDAEASLTRDYILYFFTLDDTVELFDQKNQRIFLKRTLCDGVNLDNLYPGSTVQIFSRHMKIVDYADNHTKQELMTKRQKTFGMIKPDAVEHMDKIIQIVVKKGFQIINLRMAKMTKQHAMAFYKEHEGREFYPFLTEYMSSGPVVAMELMGENAITRWRELIGPTDSAKAREEAPDSLRAMFGKDKSYNAVHGSVSEEGAQAEAAMFFPTDPLLRVATPRTTAVLRDSTCCVVKPHAVRSGHLGDIIAAIKENDFSITAMDMVYLDQLQAEVFLEVYKGVVPEYPGMVNQLIDGASVALEVTGRPGEGEEAVKRFRDLVGPSCPPMQTECVKGPWSSEEDEMLMELVKKYGPKRWTLISRMLKGRVGKQCRERWHNHLNPNVNKSAWTPEEDLVLVRAHRQLGNQWAKIAQFLPGRTDNAIKNRWNSSLRRWKQQRSSSHLSGTSDGEEDLVLPCEDGGSSQGSLESVSASSQVSATKEDSSWSTAASKLQLESPEHQSTDSAFWDTASETPNMMENDDDVSLVEVAQDDKDPPVKVECGEPVEDTTPSSPSADYILPDVSMPIFDTRDVLSPPPKGHMPLSSIENVCTPVKFWMTSPNSPKTPTPFKEAVAETVSRRGPITYTPESPGRTLDDIVELIKTDPVNEPHKIWEDVAFGKTKDQVQLTQQAHAFLGRNRTYRRLLMQ
ncbi:uncharacterized protein [Anabrus simplex]|uniref:uncharacterized protein n=1 Tax=Anabrus simplex TaxID=316456 RepID=UPI0035A3CD8D